MSRCFPYPPPNYRRSEAAAALIESIKHKREEADEKRKDKKRHKKEKKEKLVISKDEHGKSKHREHKSKKRKLGDRNEAPKSKEVLEHLERSGLTEEHGLPCLVLEPCESSESTQNSSKSRKLESAHDISFMSKKLEASSGSQGSTGLRFRLPLQKQRDPESIPEKQITTSKTSEAAPVLPSRTASKVLEAPPVLSSRPTSKGLESTRVDPYPGLSSKTSSKIIKQNPASDEPCFRLPLQRHTEPESIPDSQTATTSKISEATSVFPSRTAPKVSEAASDKECFSGRTDSRAPVQIPANEEPCFSGRITKSTAGVKDVAADAGKESHSKSKRKSREHKLERRYREITVNWKPAPFLFTDVGDGDQDWLFGSSSSEGKCRRPIDSGSDFGREVVSSSIQPKACYLPELETYVLPYAIPF